MKNISEILSKLKDFNLYAGNDVLEECESDYELMFQITITLFNNYFVFRDLKNERYLESIKDEYIIGADNQKIFISEFVDMIYNDGGDQWRIRGDEKYDEELS